MKKINKMYVMLLGVSLFFANAKASGHQETFTDKDNQTTVKKSSLSKYMPFVAVSAALLIAGGFVWKYFFSSTPNDPSPNDSIPRKQSSNNQQTITDQDAQSFLEDVLEITREATSCKTVSEEVEKYLQECLNFFKNPANRKNLEKALNKWESSDEIDDCLTKFIQNIITKDPSFKPLAKKYPAIFTELQEGRIPTILARYDHDNPRSQGHEWTCGCCHLSSPTLKDFLIQRIRIGLTEGQKFIQGDEEDGG